MDEAIVEVVENTPSTTPAVEQQEPAKTEPAAKIKGGRPAGAKDKAPRKKKVVIVEEEVPQKHEKTAPTKTVDTPQPSAAPTSATAPTPEPASAPEPARASEPAREPPSPRSIMRQSANHMLELKRLNDAARKTHLQSTYTRRLAAF